MKDKHTSLPFPSSFLAPEVTTVDKYDFYFPSLFLYMFQMIYINLYT